jgi:integrase
VDRVKRVKDSKYLCERGKQFYFRRKAPKGLEWAFGGQEIVTVSLRTDSLKQARTALAKELLKFERIVKDAPARHVQPVEPDNHPIHMPSKIEIDETVRAWLSRRLEREANASFAVGRTEDHLQELIVHQQDVQTGLGLIAREPAMTTAWIAEALVHEKKWAVEAGDPRWRYLCQMVAHGQSEVNARLKHDWEGSPRKEGDARFLPDEYRQDAERAEKRKQATPVSLTGLLDDSLAEKKLAPATAKVWRRHIARFIEFVGHDDAAKITRADIVAWKQALLTRPNSKGALLSNRTVRDSYLAAIKSVLSWGVENDDGIAASPAAGLRVAGRTAPKVRDRGLTDREANMILAATLNEEVGRLSPERALARRWVPWLCAYTGARVNEMTQLRAEDVAKEGDFWTIHITPEAGSTKNGEPRTVALHSHLFEQGFPSIVKGKAGPIFYDPTLHRGGGDAHPQNKKVGEFLARWVRKEVGVDDQNIWPNHGWRHRFKTQARLVRMDPGIRDYIQWTCNGFAPVTGAIYARNRRPTR